MNFPFFVGQSPTLGVRGIIASEDIKSGQLLESCPVIVVPKEQFKHIEKSILQRYYWEWGEDSAIILGYGSLFNHSYDADVEFKRDFEKNLMNFSAVKDIKKGQEIFINYNGPYNDKNVLEDWYGIPKQD